MDESDEIAEGRSMMNKITCPDGFKCKRLKGQSESVCCPIDLTPAAADNQEIEDTTVKQPSSELFSRIFLGLNFFKRQITLVVLSEMMNDRLY